MCNCGNKRAQFSSAQTQTLAKQTLPAQQKKMWPDVAFQYLGKTALTVTGVYTGKNYRFSLPGDVVQIDYRDATSMRLVPLLKRI